MRNRCHPVHPKRTDLLNIQTNLSQNNRPSYRVSPWIEQPTAVHIQTTSVSPLSPQNATLDLLLSSHPSHLYFRWEHNEHFSFSLYPLLLFLWSTFAHDFDVFHNLDPLLGDKQYKFEEILPIYKTISGETDTGTFADFMEGFKTFDREGQGYISSAELRNVITMMGMSANILLMMCLVDSGQRMMLDRWWLLTLLIMMMIVLLHLSVWAKITNFLYRKNQSLETPISIHCPPPQLVILHNYSV